MISLRDCTDETLEDVREPVLRRCWIERWRCGLLSQDRFDFRDDLRQHAAIRAEGFGQTRTKSRQAFFALREELPDKAAERLRHRTIRNIPNNLVELARDEVPALPDDRFVQLLYQLSLAYPGVAGNEHQRSTATTGFIERAQQVVDFRIASVQFLRNQEALRYVVPAKREKRNVLPCGPFVPAPLQIACEAERALIPILGSLRKQLLDDSRQLLGNSGIEVCDRRRH